MYYKIADSKPSQKTKYKSTIQLTVKKNLTCNITFGYSNITVFQIPLICQ